jgi:hypothetical protein
VVAALTVYAVGSIFAVLRTDAQWPGRVLLALLWPLGPLAFALTVALLLAASLVAYPLFGAVVGGVALLWWVAG